MTLYIAVSGTSDQSCWLAEACKILVWGVFGVVWQSSFCEIDPLVHGETFPRYFRPVYCNIKLEVWCCV